MKLLFENWRKFLKEEKWEDFDTNKGEWTNLSARDIEAAKDPANVDITDELLALIDNAYKDIGGNFDFRNPGDIPGDADFWLAVDLDDDPEPDAVRVGKTKPAGLKLSASGNDGSRAAIEAFKQKTSELLNTPGHYGEMSKGVAHVMIKYFQVPFVADPEIVQKVLGPSKPIKWLGPHPEGKYPGYDGWYTRTISGHEDEMKIMLGTPNA